MSGDNATGAVDQQERPSDLALWIVGFVDGEGCFGISFARNGTCRLGVQVQPEFSVTQGQRSKGTLELMRSFFDCGTIIKNTRHDNHREPLFRYAVRRRSDLCEVIVPFFEANPLRSAKVDDFALFVDVLELMKGRTVRICPPEACGTSKG